jgi:hypothetical protein
MIMKKILLLTLFFLSIGVFSQVGVGTTVPNGALDVTSTNDGLLIPRIALAATNVATVITPTTSEMVYNTFTSAVGPNQVTPGYYYWNGALWVRLATGNSADWSLTGNSGTTPGTNFVGTTDNQSLVFRANNTEWMRIVNTGNVGIGITAPTTKLEVSSGATADAIFGHSNNVGGVLGREANITLGVPTQTLSGSGVYANNPAAGYTSVYAQSTGGATVAANIAYSDVWMASYNYVQNGSATVNPSAGYNQLNVTSGTLGGFQTAVRGYSSKGTTAGNVGYTTGGQFTSSAQNQDAIGTLGESFSSAAGGISVGGYFSGNNYAGTNFAYAFVGGTTNGATARKITGTGSVAEIIPTENHGRVTLTCPESPEYWYQDYGTVNMVNGKATIVLDDILADIIIVNEENPIRVICTPVGMPYFNGVTIMGQTNKTVEILELNGGNHSGKLQYQLVVKPKTNFGEGRFPQAPGPAYLKADKEPMAAKAKNQPNDGREIYQWPSDHVVYKYNPEDYIAVGDVVPAGPNAGKIFLGNGKYSKGVPAENPAKKK